MYNMNQFYKLHSVKRIVIVGNIEMTPRILRFRLSFSTFDSRCTCPEAPFTRAMFIDGSKFRKQFLIGRKTDYRRKYDNPT